MTQPRFNPQDITPVFDRHLCGLGLSFSAIAIGGAALSIIGIVAADWVSPLDANPHWPAHVATNVLALRRRLGRA